MTTVSTSNEEMVTVREAMRTLNKMVDQLAAGEREKFVLMRHGKMVAIITSVEVNKGES